MSLTQRHDSIEACLDDARAAGGRRDFQTESPAVDRLLEAVQEELLPALRRVGYEV
jgi:hypothetical protein